MAGINCLFRWVIPLGLLELTVLMPANVQANMFMGLGPSQANGVSTVSEAYRVSDSGEVAVGRAIADGEGHPFVWSSSDGFHVIEETGTASGVSGNGQIVVGEHFDSDAGTILPFRWTKTIGFELLPLPIGVGTDTFTVASAASYDGSVIVGTTQTFKAIRWVNGGTPEFLDETQNPFRDDDAIDVSANGETITGLSRAIGENNAVFLWTPEDSFSYFENSVDPGTHIFPTSISADGQTVVGESFTQQAFVWSEHGGMSLLREMPGQAPAGIAPQFSFATGVSGSGEAVVGYASEPSPDPMLDGIAGQAFVWTPQRGMESLQVLLRDQYGLGAALNGWKLKEARDISPDGRAIVGTGLNPDGVFQAWLVRLDTPIFVPEPNTLAIAALLAVSAICSYRRH